MSSATARPAAAGPAVAVLVLGDVGRSPRMQYHALSLASLGRRVLLIGYRGERCVPAIEAQPERIRQVRLRADLIPRLPRALYVVYAPLKAVLQVLQLLWVLLVRAPRADVLLVQTPPAIPSLAAVWLVRLVRCVHLALVLPLENGSNIVLFLQTLIQSGHPPRHRFSLS